MIKSLVRKQSSLCWKCLGRLLGIFFLRFEFPVNMDNMMIIQIQLFANLRDCLPSDSRRGKAEVEIPDGSNLQDLIDHLGIEQCLGEGVSIADQIESWQISIDGEFIHDLERVLTNGNQVIVFPHMAGG